jgi:uncharacterized protein involved in cysteine biosynthesis
MLQDLTRALNQLGTPPFLKVLLISSALTLALFAALWVGLDALLAQVDPSGWPGWLQTPWRWVDDLAAVPLVLLGLWLLFPAIATGIMAIFLDGIVDAVEAQHYPDRRAPRSMGLVEGARLGLGSALRLIGWNLAALPLYLILLFTAVGPFLLFLALNGYLLGRDLWQMVAVRHLDGREAALRRANRGAVFSTGLVTSLIFLVPIANLVAPLLGAALATHGVQRALTGRVS